MVYNFLKKGKQENNDMETIVKEIIVKDEPETKSRDVAVLCLLVPMLSKFPGVTVARKVFLAGRAVEPRPRSWEYRKSWDVEQHERTCHPGGSSQRRFVPELHASHPQMSSKKFSLNYIEVPRP